MRKFRESSVEATDLIEYLAGQDDFDLELFVYRSAKEAGLEVSHGGSYEDPVTNKPRQYDIRAAKEAGGCRIDLSIECKGLKTSYPLLSQEFRDRQRRVFTRSFTRARVERLVHI